MINNKISNEAGETYRENKMKKLKLYYDNLIDFTLNMIHSIYYRPGSKIIAKEGLVNV